MNIHDATEQAYKRGYEAGVKEFAKKFKQLIGVKEFGLVDNLAKELTESKNDFEGRGYEGIRNNKI